MERWAALQILSLAVLRQSRAEFTRTSPSLCHAPSGPPRIGAMPKRDAFILAPVTLSSPDGERIWNPVSGEASENRTGTRRLA